MWQLHNLSRIKIFFCLKFFAFQDCFNDENTISFGSVSSVEPHQTRHYQGYCSLRFELKLRLSLSNCDIWHILQHFAVISFGISSKTNFIPRIEIAGAMEIDIVISYKLMRLNEKDRSNTKLLNRIQYHGILWTTLNVLHKNVNSHFFCTFLSVI